MYYYMELIGMTLFMQVSCHIRFEIRQVTGYHSPADNHIYRLRKINEVLIPGDRYLVIMDLN